MKYLFDPSIKYKSFEKLWNTIPSGGIEPIKMSEIVHQLIKEKKLYCWYTNNEIFISLQPPKGKCCVVKNNRIEPL